MYIYYIINIVAVHFICDYDPFNLDKYRYSVYNSIIEAPEYMYDDGAKTIILNTRGLNDKDVPKELVSFLHFVRDSDISGNLNPDNDALIDRIINSVNQIKINREIGARYMTFERLLNDKYKEGIQDGRIEGRIEGKIELILDILNSKYSISKELSTRLYTVKEEAVITEILKHAVNSTTIDDFNNALNKIL